MKTEEFLDKYANTSLVRDVTMNLQENKHGIWLKEMAGSSTSVLAASVTKLMKGTHLFILNEKEQAAA